jgi:fatty acid desaturase
VRLHRVSTGARAPDERRLEPPQGGHQRPEPRPETIAYVRKQMVRFGVGLLVFICYVHWLVVRANELTPPRIPAGPFVSALAVFVGFVLLWVALFFARFRNVPG